MICPNCGIEHEIRRPFCYNCGAALPEESIPAEPEVLPMEILQPEESACLEPETAAQEMVEEEAVLPVGDEEIPAVMEELLPIAAEDPIPAAPLPEPAPPVRGRHWPAVLIMAIFSVIGTLLFFLIPNATSNSTAKPGKSCFSIEDGMLTFHEEYYTGNGSLTVPETVDGQTVTGLSQGCFRDCDSLYEIILPDTLFTVGDFAFAECDALRGLQLPDGVRYIGSNAFSKCFQLEAIHIPASVKVIGANAFGACNDLRFIFFDDTGAVWNELYPDYITEGLQIYCTDGAFTHGG